MAKFVLKDAKLFYNQYDLSGHHNSMTFAVSVGEVEATSFGDDGVRRLGGLESFNLSHSGFWDLGSSQVDTVLFNAIGDADTLITVRPNNDTTGATVYFSRAVSFEYSPGGSVGEAAAFTATAMSQGDKIVRGTLLKDGEVSGTSGEGLALNLGGATTSQILYAALHVYGSNGDGDIDVTIESDSSSGFSSATTRKAFTSVTAPGLGSQWSSSAISGLTADVWWRCTWDQGGTATGASFAVSVGFTS